MDASIFRWVNRLAGRTGWAHPFFRLNANYGILVFAALLLGAYLDARHRADLAALSATVWAAAAALAALGVGQVIGGAVDRARPYAAMSGVHVLVDRTTDFSFPSDHATVAGAVAVGLVLADRRWGIAAGCAALLMAFTRVYVGAHYPGDVLAGLGLGALIAAIGFVVIVPLLRRVATWLSAGRLSPLVVAPRAAPG